MFLPVRIWLERAGIFTLFNERIIMNCKQCAWFRATMKDDKPMPYGHCYARPPVILAISVPVQVPAAVLTVRAAQAGKRGDAPPLEMEYSVQPVSLRSAVQASDGCAEFSLEPQRAAEQSRS